MHCWYAVNGRLVGRNGPVFQFTGNLQELQFGPAQFEFSVNVGGLLVVNVQAGVGLVASVGRSCFHAASDRFQFPLSDLPFQPGHIACRSQLAQGTLQLQRIFANLVAGQVCLLACHHGVCVGLFSFGFLDGVVDGNANVQAASEVVGQEIPEVHVVVVIFRQISILG